MRFVPLVVSPITRIGLPDRADDLRVELVADVVVALKGNHVLEAGVVGDLLPVRNAVTPRLT